MKYIALVVLFCLVSSTTFSQTNVSAEFTLNEKSKKEVIDAVISALRANYVFPEVADKMEKAIREKYSSGGYECAAVRRIGSLTQSIRVRVNTLGSTDLPDDENLGDKSMSVKQKMFESV